MEDFTLEELSLAYRKAKVDAFYSTTSAEMLFDFCCYEVKFESRINNLLSNINKQCRKFFSSKDFLGSWGLLEKSLTSENLDDGEVIFSSAVAGWKKLQNSGAKVTAEFRVSSRLSVDFIVLSALWAMLVGEKYDRCLNDKCVYGSRMRRQRDGDFNHRSIGSLKPYLESYQSWRDNALQSVEQNMQQGKDLLVLNADVSSFYHELDASFMLDEQFNRMLGIELEPREQQLHEIFIKALVAWAKKTPLGKGLPINIPAAAIISNVALWNFDRMVCREMLPLYYGRYVDDIIVVMENPAGMSSVAEVFEWMIKRSDSSLQWEPQKGSKRAAGKQTLRYHEDFLKNSAIRFNANKTKLFVLDADSSPALLATLQKNINRRGSVWRMLPQNETTERDILSNFARVIQEDGQAAEVLRRAEGLSIQRTDFAVMLRDFEAVSRDLHPNSWQKQRRAFIKLYVSQLMVLPHFFEFSSYLERIVGLATSCGDYEDLRSIIDQLFLVTETVKAGCVWKIKASKAKRIDKQKIFSKWTNFLSYRVGVSVIRNFDYNMSQSCKETWDEYLADYFPISKNDLEENNDKVILEVPYVITYARWFYNADLAAASFREQFMPHELYPNKKQLDLTSASLLSVQTSGFSFKHRSDLRFLAEKADIDTKKGLPMGLCFPTRPPGFGEISLLCQPLEDKLQRQRMVSLVGSLRGYNAARLLPAYSKTGVMNIKYGKLDADKIRVALLALPQDEQELIAAANSCAHFPYAAYQKLMSSLNELLQGKPAPHYLVLPELSLPAHLFMRLALKLARHGTSLIAGLQFLPHGKSSRANPLWSTFVHDALGFNSIVTYLRDKQYPSSYESNLLHEIGAKKFKARSTQAPAVINHGGVYLSVLAASEIANLDYRKQLQGKIDILLCPNITSPESTTQLVQQAACDLGCYVFRADGSAANCLAAAPCNSSALLEATSYRSRHGYDCLVYEVDVLQLRRYQTGARANPCGFAALPPGFTLSPARKLR